MKNQHLNKVDFLSQVSKYDPARKNVNRLARRHAYGWRHKATETCNRPWDHSSASSTQNRWNNVCIMLQYSLRLVCCLSLKLMSVTMTACQCPVSENIFASCSGDSFIHSFLRDVPVVLCIHLDMSLKYPIYSLCAFCVRGLTTFVFSKPSPHNKHE